MKELLLAIACGLVLLVSVMFFEPLWVLIIGPALPFVIAALWACFRLLRWVGSGLSALRKRGLNPS